MSVDLFRTIGDIIRADIDIRAHDRPKGSGTVVVETPKDDANTDGEMTYGETSSAPWPPYYPPVSRDCQQPGAALPVQDVT
ncbi:hypothetical protein D9619_007693 [Psilocybe cf. subviscida]|uniref:Uncharacterized protein n=1 Tax=Psilocybe cf. subviscida TaxID=2480587 RepID=A0A8H5ESA1_9AGAR|nr:hypothetical protein D9619_007693 [Psilocybe cf. subviscida]